ncbi:MAG: hypothetical protein AAF903_00800 [Pseudomonadota bacterium]
MELPENVELEKSAAFDVRLFSIPDKDLEEICKSLLKLPYLDGDEPLGPYLGRKVAGWYVVFRPTRQSGRLHIDIVRIMHQKTDSRRKAALRALKWLAAFRGGFGV